MNEQHTPQPTIAEQEATLIALIARCHAGSRLKGFWPDNNIPDPDQQLMLVVSELAEAIEGDRKGKTANLKGMQSEIDYIGTYGTEHTDWGKQRYADSFQSCIKDSPEDEIADAYIRLLDFIGGYALDTAIIAERVVFFREQDTEEPYEPNFGKALLAITRQVCLITDPDFDDGRDIPFGELAVADALRKIETLCVGSNIDLFRHIDLKLRYNSQRPAKHGKAY